MPRHGQRKTGGLSAARTKELREAVGEIVAYAGLELVDVTYRREAADWVLRVLIDKPGGVTLESLSIYAS